MPIRVAEAIWEGSFAQRERDRMFRIRQRI